MDVNLGTDENTIRCVTAEEFTIVGSILHSTRTEPKEATFDRLKRDAQINLDRRHLFAYPDQVNGIFQTLLDRGFIEDSTKYGYINHRMETAFFISDKGRAYMDNKTKEMIDLEDKAFRFMGFFESPFFKLLKVLIIASVLIASFYLGYKFFGLDWTLISSGILLMVYGRNNKDSRGEKVEIGAGTLRVMGSIGAVIFLIGVIILVIEAGYLPFS